MSVHVNQAQVKLKVVPQILVEAENLLVMSLTNG